ncbi:MAG: Helix-turn-helix domain [Bacteroidota bacterium]|jgi:ribosome-binding protein aMBF1 (putative translation factor)
MSKFFMTGALLTIMGSFILFPKTEGSDEKKPKPNAIIRPLKDQIHFKREERSMTVAQLAKATDSTPVMIEKIEKGETIPTRELIVKIQEALKAEFILDGY